MKKLFALALALSFYANPALAQSNAAQTPTPQSTTPVQQSDTGKVKGVLSYFFNSNFGSKPDTGSKVYILEGSVEIPEAAFVMGVGSKLVVGKEGQEAKDFASYKVIATATADGAGNFQMSEVPAGVYTLVFISKHATGKAQRDVAGKVRTRSEVLKAGETADASLDFGMSYL